RTPGSTRPGPVSKLNVLSEVPRTEPCRGARAAPSPARRNRSSSSCEPDEGVPLRCPGTPARLHPRHPRPQSSVSLSRVLAVLVVFVAVFVARAEAGHEIPYYPSFYPQEIALSVAEPAAALRLFAAKNAIHAYVGGLPAPKGPAELAWVESLRGFAVLTFNPGGRAFAEARARCAAAARLAPILATAKSDYVVYPYPVTPWHDDYVHHADLIEAAKARPASPAPVPRLRLRKGFASLAAGPAWRA